MNRQKWIVLLAALVLISGTGATLGYLRKHQKLGRPGVVTAPIAGSPRLEVYLPEQVLDYTSTNIPMDTNLLNGLPQDTSFAARIYINPATNWVQMRIVLMGTDRTSIHKPEFCLTGVGWNIDRQEYDTVHVGGARPGDLELRKLMATKPGKFNERDIVLHGIYMYWFVAENELTASHSTRMFRTATHLLTTGELQRWAYVSCFVVCLPGGEDAACERVKKFIGASVPEFQLSSGARGPGGPWSQTSSAPQAR
jgi:hypothetical protein